MPMPPNDAEQKIARVSAKKEKPQAGNASGESLSQMEMLAFERAKLESASHINGQNLGWLGKFFGAKTNAVTNIAGLSAIIAGLAAIFCVGEIMYLLGTYGKEAKDIVSVPASITTLALGYLFGKSGK